MTTTNVTTCQDVDEGLKLEWKIDLRLQPIHVVRLRVVAMHLVLGCFRLGLSCCGT